MTSAKIAQTLNFIDSKLSKAKEHPRQLVKVKAGWYAAYVDGELYEFDCVINEGVPGWNLLIDGSWAQTFRTLSAAKKASGL